MLAIRIINSGELTFWSVEDEKRYQTLLSKESKGKWQIINGVNTKVEVTAEMFSTELKELIEKKEAIITELDEKSAAAYRAHLLETNPNLVARMDAALQNEKTPTEETAGASR